VAATRRRNRPDGSIATDTVVAELCVVVAEPVVAELVRELNPRWHHVSLQARPPGSSDAAHPRRGGRGPSHAISAPPSQAAQESSPGASDLYHVR
jgi:hypothetical protein